MKILFVTHDTEKQSGWGRYSSSVIEHIGKGGEEVSVVVEYSTSHHKKMIDPAHSFVHILKNMYKVRRFAESYDVVHALDVWPYALYSFAAVLGTRKKLFLSGIGTYSVAPLDSLIKKIILIPMLKRAEKIFCISNYVRDEMLKRVPFIKAEVVHMGFTPLPKLSLETYKKYESAYHLSGRTPILLTVGAIKHRKGQFNTVQALLKLKDSYPHILYLIVGSDKEKPYVNLIQSFIKEKGMEKNVRIISNVHDDEALSFFYGSADLFVMNSNNAFGHFEGFGLVFLEAENFGKPVIGSCDCGIEDALENGYNGYLTNQGDTEDIANKVILALKDKERLGKNSLEFVKKFSWDILAKKYIEEYRKSLV